MKIDNIQINGFGKIKNKNINLKNGINLIYGNNESGKSTLVNFIKAMFYGVNKNKSGQAFSELERFKPWGDLDFSGKIEYEIEEKKYTAVREFNKNNCKVYDENGIEITNNFNKDKSRGAEIGLEQLSIDEETFVNTIFVSQDNVQIDNIGRKSVIQKLTNMIQSGDESTSYDKTKQKLQKKLLEEVGTERTQNKPLNAITREINLLEEKKQNLILNKERRDNISELEKDIDAKISNVEKDLEKANKVLEIKNRYVSLLKERENDYEILVKIAEKEYQNQLENNKKLRKITTDITLILTLILILSSALLKWYLPCAIIALIGIILVITFNKIFSREIKKAEVPNFDVVKEDFKKKENKELYFLKKEGIGESLSTRKIQDLQKLIEGLKKKKSDLILEKHKLKVEVETLKENLDRLNEIEERLEELYEKETEIRKLEYSIKLAITKLDEAYISLKEEVVPKLENAIKNSIAETTNNKYQKIFYNDQDGILIENQLGDIVTIDKLSVGTIDQAYLGFRLGVAKETANLPLILDESFAFYDNERLENILRLFVKNYSERQILILSCSSREKEILEKMNVEFNLIKIEE